MSIEIGLGILTLVGLGVLLYQIRLSYLAIREIREIILEIHPQGLSRGEVSVHQRKKTAPPYVPLD